MVLQLRISEEAEARLRDQAHRAGLDLETFAARQLERAARPRTLEDILGPRQSTPADGMSDDELSEFLEAEIHAHRAERRAEQGR